MRRKEERKNEDGAKDERGEKKRGRGWEKRRGDRRWEMVEKRRTVQGVKKKKKKKKLRWSSAGSTTAAGGDDLLKATRSQPLGPKRGTTLLVFRCSLFSLSAPYSSRSLSLLLVPSFCLSHFRSVSVHLPFLGSLNFAWSFLSFLLYLSCLLSSVVFVLYF